MGIAGIAVIARNRRNRKRQNLTADKTLMSLIKNVLGFFPISVISVHQR